MNTKLKKIPLNWQIFSLIRKADNLYIDKTKQILNIIENFSDQYFYISRPRRWWKTLTIDTMKEIFLGNKELFKGLYAYDNYKEWDKSYPVVVFDFAWFDPNTDNDNLLNFINSRTTIYIKDKIYWTLKEYLWHSNLIDLKELIIKLYNETNMPVVLLFDEYDTPYTYNLNNSINFNKIKDFFYKFYSQVKSSWRYIRLFYFSWLTKVGQTSLFSSLNNLTDISFKPGYYDTTWYTLKEIKENFKEYIKNACEYNKITEEELIKKLKQTYDWYYFWNKDDRLFNPISINNFFTDYQFLYFWNATWSRNLMESVNVSFNPLLFKKILTQLNEKNVIIPTDMLKIDSLDNLSIPALLLQSWYLTYEDFQEWTVRFANDEAINALYINFKSYIENNVQLSSYLDNLKKLYSSIINLEPTKIEQILNQIFEEDDDSSEWINKNPEWFFKGIFVRDLRLSWFKNITKEEWHLKGKSDIIIYEKDEVFIIEVKIWNKNDAKKTAIEQIDKQYASWYKFHKIHKLGISWDARWTKEIFVEIVSE